MRLVRTTGVISSSSALYGSAEWADTLAIAVARDPGWQVVRIFRALFEVFRV